MLLKSILAMSILLAAGLLFPLIKNTTTAVEAQPKGKDSISFNTTLQPTGSTQLNIPQKSNFTLGPGSPLCPTNNCKQELIGAFYSVVIPQSPSVQGTLKIENKTISTPAVIRYSLIPFLGNLQITSTQEDRKTGHSITEFSGDLGLGGGTSPVDAAANPEFKYNVTGTLDNTTKLLAFEGQRNTS
ncbi:MAG: hypothetical protein WCF23_11535 [Candidatus Nitrosopolaris sp.]